MTREVSRRRFISISAATGALAFSANGFRAGAPPYRWRGVALGADAEIALYHENPIEAAALTEDCLREVRRLEGILSLYRPDSTISRLNSSAILNSPPLELIDLLSRASTISQATHGAFDVTIQLLWYLYANHFSLPDADPAGPTPQSVSAVLDGVDYRMVSIDAQRINFLRPGMAISLNGIAQGYITDRAADRLRSAGMTDVLVNMGETRALGGHPDGAPWRIGLNDRTGRSPTAAEIELRDAAVATSGGYGFQFSPDGIHHHILDPRTGASPVKWNQVSIVADDATTADALSTAAMMMSVDELRDMVRHFVVRAYVQSTDGTIRRF